MEPVNFLDCVQRLSFECGIAGPGPSSVVGQTGHSFDLVAWTASAWKEIQGRRLDWAFMLVSPGFSFTTVAGQAIYTPTQMGIAAPIPSSYKRETFRNFLTSAGTPTEVFMEYVEYDNWRDLYQLGTLRTTQVRPLAFTITPGKLVGLQTPLAGYTITGDYFTGPIPMTKDTDVPSIPNQYIMAIVYKGMMSYGAFENAPEVYNRGEDRYNSMMKKMEVSRLPEVRGVGGLA